MSIDQQAAQYGALLAGLSPPSMARGEIEALAWQIGTDVAGPAAGSVDAEARFPAESLAALREARLLGALVPREFGGRGASLPEVMSAVRALAAHCASSALVLAMHSIEVVNLARFGTTGSLPGLLEEVASEQLLLANANSEVGLGGDVGRSLCALEPGANGNFHLDKQTLAVSYGEYADAIVATARRAPESAETDQVFVVCRRAELSLEATSTWNTMGLRGTCSRGYRLVAEVDPKLIFPVPFSLVANRGGGQARQLLLSAVWVGLAEAATAQAHAYVRRAARKNIGTVPPAALRLTELVIDLQEARSLLTSGALWFESVKDGPGLEDVAFAVTLRNLKVATSRLAVETAAAALVICGIEGYRRDGALSLDRVIRDAHGGLVMVSNDRYLQDNAQLLGASKVI